MVLGARDVEGVGMILLYESTDLKNWTYKGIITTPQDLVICGNVRSVEMDRQLYIIFAHRSRNLSIDYS